jgi:hypothetical protein
MIASATVAAMNAGHIQAPARRQRIRRGQAASMHLRVGVVRDPGGE